jgi:hypothetical protein
VKTIENYLLSILFLAQSPVQVLYLLVLGTDQDGAPADRLFSGRLGKEGRTKLPHERSTASVLHRNNVFMGRITAKPKGQSTVYSFKTYQSITA